MLRPVTTSIATSLAVSTPAPTPAPMSPYPRCLYFKKSDLASSVYPIPPKVVKVPATILLRFFVAQSRYSLPFSTAFLSFEVLVS